MKKRSRMESASSFPSFKFYLLLIPLFLLTTQCAKERVLPVEEEKESLIFDLSTIEDSEIRNFLDYNYLSSVNPYLKAVLESRGGEKELLQQAITALYELDQKQGYIKHINKKYGIPVWDRYDMLSSTAGEPVPFVPLAFANGQETTGFFMIVPRGNNFHFFLYKKDKIDKHLEKGKIWKNMAFAILESTKFDIELFDNPRAAYLDWLESNVEDVKAPNEDLENRGCSVVQVETCYYPGAQAATDETEDLENRYDPYCVYTEEWTCDGGDSSCMECGSGGDTGGSSSGGSSNGSSNSDETTVEDGIYFPTCVSSFDFVKIQEAFYTEVLDIHHSYLLSNNIWEEYDIANLCIQVRDRNAAGQYISADRANELAAEAMDRARLLTFWDLESGLTFNPRRTFLSYYERELRNRFGGFPSIITNHCSGNDIPSQKNKHSYFGVCLPYWGG